MEAYGEANRDPYSSVGNVSVITIIVRYTLLYLSILLGGE